MLKKYHYKKIIIFYLRWFFFFCDKNTSESLVTVVGTTITTIARRLLLLNYTFVKYNIVFELFAKLLVSLKKKDKRIRNSIVVNLKFMNKKNT